MHMYMCVQVCMCMWCVCMQDQYMFIHDAVLEQLVCGDTQIQAKDLNWTLRRPQQPQRQRDGSIKTDLALQFDVIPPPHMHTHIHTDTHTNHKL